MIELRVIVSINLDEHVLWYFVWSRSNDRV
jgi:hypothetical protein